MEIGWAFPLNNYGQEHGFNDAGIETYRGNPWGSLARETIQNSLDAKDPSAGKPVEVCFEMLEFPTEDFPGKTEFERVLKSCADYWKHQPKTVRFFEKALSVLSEEDVLPVLKISDFNTTGLTGSDKETGSDWHKLIKSVGTSDKSGAAGGSYGIGKYAPFACSLFRTVFYVTRDKKNNYAFQGVARLVTHKDQSSQPTQGTGYFGVKDKNRPITDEKLVDPFFCRTEVGTDLFVFGFSNTEDWEKRIIKSVIENFFMALHRGLLIVKVQNACIDHSTLPHFVSKYADDDKEWPTDAYYKALISNDATVFDSSTESLEWLDNLGRLELRLLAGRDFPKKVAMIRETGMKIFDKGRFHVPARFAGVLYVSGEKLNEFLRAVEPPGHDSWEPDRHENPSYAKTLLKNINSWVNNKVKELLSTKTEEESDIEGMSRYLPDDFDELDGSLLDAGHEGISGKPVSTYVATLKSAPWKSAGYAPAEVAVASEDCTVDENATLHRNIHRNINKNESIPPLETRPFSQNILLPAGGQNENGEHAAVPGNKPTKLEGTALGIKSARAFCTDPGKGEYRLLIEPESSCKGCIRLYIIGEDNEPEPALVEGARMIAADGTQKEINVSNTGAIGPIDLKKGKKTALAVVLKEPLRCSLEVCLFEG